ncbi:DUF771 domain-containing protein [Bombilactobacillus folatiphilus]|uniref:DUF771 domain-containing protein n=1 Tax=Bombilactobacillus folatiphilus TaxID=2923362 RepID=A0ABY4PA77_9LACO|nr:DUF771 domain-containing protein [Bombilactobacillus folatiphilus]UQS82583.1 DUF771 domain-containing protein [Bombilactobacillus folatiphilus]
MIAIDEIDQTVQAIDLSGVQIELSPDQIIIPKTEYKDLREAVDNEPVFWTLKQAQEYLGVGRQSLLTIIYNPQIKKELDIEHGGCVKYWSKGSQYYFLRDDFKKYVDKNKKRLLGLLCK